MDVKIKNKSPVNQLLINNIANAASNSSSIISLATISNKYAYYIINSRFLVNPNIHFNWFCKYGYTKYGRYILHRYSGYLSQMSLNYACIHGHINCVYEILKDPLSRIVPHYSNSYAFQAASWNNRYDIVKLLLTDPRIDPTANYNFAIKYSARWGFYDTVKVLLEDSRIDPSIEQNTPIKNAVKSCNIDVIGLLLDDPRVDVTESPLSALYLSCIDPITHNIANFICKHPNTNISANDNEALKYAAKNGYIDIVEFLIKDPRIDINAGNGIVFYNAIASDCVAIVKMLMDDPRLELSETNIKNAVYSSITDGNIEKLKVLLNDPRSDCVEITKWNLIHALDYGFIDIVAYLMSGPKIDESHINEIIIKKIALKNSVEIIDLIFKLEKFRGHRSTMLRWMYYNNSELVGFFQYYQ